MLEEPGDGRAERDAPPPPPRRHAVYLAGPIEGSGQPHLNLRAAAILAADLMDRGFAPVVPHASLILDAVAPRPRELWMAVDFALLSRCDVVLRIPGKSPGADAECAEAQRLGIPVVTGLDALLDWSASRRPQPQETPCPR
jgi:nucleoside 2-deoxyribosyltransferase